VVNTEVNSPSSPGDTWSMDTIFPFGEVTVNVMPSFLLSVDPVISIVVDPSTAFAEISSPASIVTIGWVGSKIPVSKVDSVQKLLQEEH